MGNISLPTAQQTGVPSKLPVEEIVNKKEESRFSFNEKLKLFLILILSITLPVLSTFLFSRNVYQKELKQYKDSYQQQIEQVQNQVNLLTNPSVKKLEEYEIVIRNKIIMYHTEKEKLEKDPVFQDLIKKTKELDKQIIICNVHLQNIEMVKQNKYKEVDLLLEKLNKENIK